MQPIAGGVLVVAGLIVAQGLLVLAEAALTGARRSRLKDWAARGDRGAEAAIRLGEDPRRFAPGLRGTGTFLGTLAGVYSGWMLVPGLVRLVSLAGWPSTLEQAVAIVGVSALLTVGTLTIAGAVPIRVASRGPESAARRLARPVGLLA
ncbi:MAG: CNNM domain-containing protein, partial [Isosphaeraceae bacterium]